MPARMLVAFRAGLLPTSAALAVLHMISAQPGRAAEVTVLLIANLADAVIRFAFYRRRVFRRKAAALSRAWLFRLGAVNSWRCASARGSRCWPAGPPPHCR